MKKLLWILVLLLLFNKSAYTDDPRDFQIEGMSIGDSALDYFAENQIEDSEIDWHNYSYKEYSTSLLPGKGIYDWFQISYKSADDNFIIEGLVGIVEKKNYDKKKCNKDFNTLALDISRLFKNIKQGRKQSYKINYNPRKIYQKADLYGKSLLTRVSYNFPDKEKIILACYNMDKATNEIDSFNNVVTNINKIDSFRVDIRSLALVDYLEKTL